MLVIGAGASGAACAWSLAEAGIDVLCLEQGGWVDPSTYPAMGPDWEVRRQTDFHPDPNVRRLRADYPVETSRTPIEPLMVFRAFAGWLVLSLEFLVAADILKSAISPTWREIGQLAAIVAIRTFLNYSLGHDLQHTPGAVHSSNKS